MVLTRVEARNQADAFEIFDAPNTTGELLTALETSKPLVIQFEANLGTYAASQSREDLESMKSTLAESYSDPAKLQTETKQMLRVICHPITKVRSSSWISRTSVAIYGIPFRAGRNFEC